MNISKEEELQIIQDYVENKICITKLAKKYHHNSRLITKILDDNNICHSRGQLRKGQSNTACKRIFTQEEKKIIYEIYSNGGTTQDCMTAVHCGESSLKELLQELGIYKSRQDVKKTLPQNQRKYFVNEDFFFIQSANLAYFLGFLAADGTIAKDRNDITISLSSIDKELLQQFKDVIGGRNLDTYITNEGFSVTRWTFTSQKIKEELKKYSIVPQKTNILKPPYCLDKQYWIDYIRGYFDGDGSVNCLSNKALRWQICSATREVLQWIIDFLYEEYHIAKVNIYSQPRKNINLYYFQYSTNATKQIYEILYTPNSWYLKRKKNKFEEILKKI